MTPLRYKRILLKLSGESLMGEQQFGISSSRLVSFAEEVREAHNGVQIGLVIGGGNIFRGVQAAAQGIDKVSASGTGTSGSCDFGRFRTTDCGNV